MGGKVIGHRITIYEQSVEVAHNTYVHITRVFAHALHSTKGWRFIKSDKTTEQVDKPKNLKMKITQEYKSIK